MNLAKVIDHTLLKPTATREQIETLCREAAEHGFCSVCVNPYWVPLAAKMLKGTGVKTCTVIGFPLGANTTEVKVFEAKTALENGADELDMVINIGALKSKDYDTVLQDIRALRALGDNFVLKVIIETSELTDEEKVKACELAAEAKADFVKTSTGFTKGGATVHDVALMKKSIPAGMQVKASGGVRTREDAEAMLAAGATRLGASSGIKIVEGK
ncbi:deoxyribose-phosphate aldolase [Candidatus Avelusimicrobium faecicola]|uniref:deoxyribose-phosphate aldolase n=1 Tax=Candidatus Avelusimicrobium faecicola TaxID=3416205 RepID=UPI002A5CA0FA|nr:deoxyribose-phosphate aldolase [Spirochaetota bacterium]MDY6128707.1 deoxyribose-phosphate aldolase [Elusimicrobiaceae bacterium]